MNVQYKQVPNLHHVSYATGYDQNNQFWMYFHCSICGDQSKRPCSNPQRINYWVVRYGSLHLHR